MAFHVLHSPLNGDAQLRSGCQIDILVYNRLFALFHHREDIELLHSYSLRDVISCWRTEGHRGSLVHNRILKPSCSDPFDPRLVFQVDSISCSPIFTQLLFISNRRSMFAIVRCPVKLSCCLEISEITMRSSLP